MADYVTKEEFEQFTSAVLSQFEWVNHHLQMLVWAQNGKGNKPIPPGYKAYNVDGQQHLVKDTRRTA